MQAFFCVMRGLVVDVSIFDFNMKCKGTICLLNIWGIWPSEGNEQRAHKLETK